MKQARILLNVDISSCKKGCNILSKSFRQLNRKKLLNLNALCLTKSHFLIRDFERGDFEHSKISFMLTLDEIFIIKLVNFIPFFFVERSLTVFHWNIVQDDKNSISSRHYSNEHNFHLKATRKGMHWPIYILLFVFVYFLY